MDEKRYSDEWRASPPKKSLLHSDSKKTKTPPKLMKTSKFISALLAAPENQLIFVDDDGRSVPAGYHLTELKAATFETVDCGGQTNHWREMIVQLWIPIDADSDHMSAGKFLKIFDKVRGMIPLDLESEIRIEYGDENFLPSTYHLRSISDDYGQTRVLLEPPATTCKARDRGVVASSLTDACCLAPASCC